MNILNVTERSMVPAENFHEEEIAPGITFRRLYPGGMAGPKRECYIDKPGGQTWSEGFTFGAAHDDFVMTVPDIRLPPQQFFPMHWHDCWTVVLITEGKCMIGDWYMETGDVFVAAPSIEYGPLIVGTMGCRLLEIFADLALSPGGYGPEYHDHPTLRGGSHVIKQRSGVNLRNQGNSALTLEGTEGMWKTRLEPGWRWELGDADDPDRSVVADTRLAAGETMPATGRGDWYAALVLDGSAQVDGRTVTRDDVILARRGSTVPAITAGADGVQLLENFRTTRAL